MNKSRRKCLSEIAEKLELLNAEIEEVRSQEEEAYDNLPESIQGAEKGERMQEIIDMLQSAFDSVEEAVNGINECQE